MLKKMNGIVLKTLDYGETHKIITIFTNELGKVSALCRGANKPKSRLSAVSQVFIHGEYLVYVRKGLSTVQQGQIIQSHRKIRESIEKTAFAAFIIELTDKIVEDRVPDPFLFQQLSETLHWINEQEDYMIPLLMYEMKLFQKGGFAPVVDHCVNCGNTSLPFAFSIQEGGVLCPNCTNLDKYAILLTDNIAKLLSIFLHVGLERVGNINVKNQNQQLLRKIMEQYYDRYGGYTLKSSRFLSQLDRFKE